MRNAEQLDRNKSFCRGARIATQPLSPAEPIMGALSPRERSRLQEGCRRRLDLDLDALLAEQLPARASVGSAIPITPKDGL